MKRFVIGDIHGGYKALIQCLERSSFDYEEDLLISLGDVADGWTEVPECFDELLKVENLIYIIGNHDEWLRNWFKFGQTPHIWTSQGGKNTINAYNRVFETMNTHDYVKWRKKHEDLLEKAVFYHMIEDVEENISWKKLFVHGGFNWHLPIEDQHFEDLMWDRHMWQVAAYWQLQHDKGKALDKVPGYDDIFIGHTATVDFRKDLTPVKLSNVWNVDQGAGWYGKLTIMDIDTKEYWQSDPVQELYPDEKGRR